MQRLLRITLADRTFSSSTMWQEKCREGLAHTLLGRMATKRLIDILDGKRRPGAALCHVIVIWQAGNSRQQQRTPAEDINECEER